MDNMRVNPLKKLQDCVSKGLGTIMIPQEVKGIIEKEVLQISTTNSEIEDIKESQEVAYKTDYSVEEITGLYKRTCSRLLYQEMKKQENIEKVIDNAKNILTEEEQVSSEDVDEDWLMRFFNSIQDVSNEQMQLLWGKVLAGEIKHPNSFLLRSLDALTKMSQEEAKLFEEMSQYVIAYGSTLAIINDRGINDKHNIDYKDVHLLDECGLIDSNTMINLTLTIGGRYPLNIVYGKEVLRATPALEHKFEFDIFKLSKTGENLMKIIQPRYNKMYFRDIAHFFAKRNSSILFSIHEIVEKHEDGTYRYKVQGETL